MANNLTRDGGLPRESACALAGAVAPFWPFDFIKSIHTSKGLNYDYQ